MPDGPHWVEAHTAGHVARLAAWRMGVLAIGDNGAIWAYPTNFITPWTQRSPKEASDLEASLTALYIVEKKGPISRMHDDQWTTIAGSGGWGVTAVSASDDDHLFAIARDKPYRIDVDRLVEVSCSQIAAKAIAAASRDELYVIDANSALYRGTAERCEPVTTPAPVRNVAVGRGRLVVVTTAGAVWRRRGSELWRELPVVRKYRSNVWPATVPAVQVTLSEYSTWLLDKEGAVYVLSDEK